MKKTARTRPSAPRRFDRLRPHRALFLNRPKDFQPGGRFLNHCGPAPFALGGQYLFDKDITQTAMDDVYGQAVTRRGVGEEFPVAEMAGENQGAGLAQFVNQLTPFGFVLKLYPLVDILRCESTQMAELGQQATKIAETFPQNTVPFGGVLGRESQGQIRQPHPTMRPVYPIQERAYPFSDPKREAKGQDAKKGEGDQEQDIFDPGEQMSFFTSGPDTFFATGPVLLRNSGGRLSALVDRASDPFWHDSETDCTDDYAAGASENEKPKASRSLASKSATTCRSISR